MKQQTIKAGLIYLSKSSLSRKTPTARGKAQSMSPSRGYSTPGGGRSRSAQETFSGSQNLSLQIQAEIEEVIGAQKILETGSGNNKCDKSGGGGGRERKKKTITRRTSGGVK